MINCAYFVYLAFCAAAAAKSLQSCPTLCDPTDGSPPGSPVPGILQARTLEWVAISFKKKLYLLEKYGWVDNKDIITAAKSLLERYSYGGMVLSYRDFSDALGQLYS